MKDSKTKVVSFRVPLDVWVKVEEMADNMRRGSTAKVIKTIFMPAFEKELRKQSKTATV